MKTLNVRNQFPIFKERPNLVYLDHAATSQKPESVISAVRNYYEKSNGSPNRGAHALSVLSTEMYEMGRRAVKSHLNVSDDFEVVFTKNATEALNLVVYCDLMQHLKAGDEVLITIDAHHSVIVPIQMAVQNRGAVLKYIYVDESGEITLDAIKKSISSRTVFLAMPWVSNALGTLHDLPAILKIAHDRGIKTLIDGAQAVGHFPIDFKKMSVDYFVFSGHKIYGPQGIGVLIGKKVLLKRLPPFLMGGDMIEFVTEQTTTFATGPKRFEAGTQNVVGVVGLKAAMDFIDSIGLDRLKAHEEKLVKKTLDAFSTLDFVKVYGTKKIENRSGLIAFNVVGIHSHDVASLLDLKGVAIRAGHHCAQPLMQHLDIPSSCRVSFSAYSTEWDVDQLITALQYVKEVFSDVS